MLGNESHFYFGQIQKRSFYFCQIQGKTGWKGTENVTSLTPGEYKLGTT